MQLGLTEEQELLQSTFAELFAAESSPDRVRAAEALGFDPALWKHLVETGAVGIRVPEALGGTGGGLRDAVILVEQAGRALASVPLGCSRSSGAASRRSSRARSWKDVASRPWRYGTRIGARRSWSRAVPPPTSSWRSKATRW